MTDRTLLLCADLHGEFRWLVHYLVDDKKISNADVIVLGDFGVGFDKSLLNEYNRIKNRLESANIKIYTLRGNHDDPKYFIREEEFSLPNLIFMEDYKIYNLCGRTILPIGGAISTDKDYTFNNGEKLRVEGKTWWAEEDIKRVPLKSLPIRVDLILSHEAPTIFEPMCFKGNLSDEDYNLVLESRKYLDQIAFNVKCDYWFFGHHHSSYYGEFNGCKYRCLAINVGKNNQIKSEIIDDMHFPKIEHNPQGIEEEGYYVDPEVLDEYIKEKCSNITQEELDNLFSDIAFQPMPC